MSSPHKRARDDAPPDGAALERAAPDVSSSDDDDAPAAARARRASPPRAAEEAPSLGVAVAQEAEHAAAAAAPGPAPVEAAAAADGSDSDSDSEPPEGPASWEWNDAVGDAADAERIAAVRADYARRMAAIMGPGVKKPDMQVFKAMREEGGVPVVWGHVRGVPIGARFAGRGELAACSVHTQIPRGIDARARSPASCVVIAGGYGDDIDNDDHIEYTGEGGQDPKSKKQVKDQTLTGGNAALALNQRTRCPVRVVRGAPQPDGSRAYFYDGLFEVRSYEKRESGDAGSARVYIFQLHRLRLHSRAAETRVAFRALCGSSVAFRNRAARAPRLQRQAERAACPPRSAAAEAARREVLRRRPGLLMEDISGGVEAVAIPLFCDAAADVNADGALPHGFTYIRHCAAAVSAAAAAVAAAEAPVAAGDLRGGDAVVAAAVAYVDGPYLRSTEAGGILESDEGEDDPNDDAHDNDAVVTAGVSLPLEVFRCADAARGWGVRCAAPILEGEFVAEYAGAAVTAAELENNPHHHDDDADESGDESESGDDEAGGGHGGVFAPDISESYVFSLNHFNSNADGGALLCVDAFRTGNVARFVNHAPGNAANCVVQAVFTRAGGADRRAFYRTALFALHNIPPFTELCYDYGPAYPVHWGAGGDAAAVAAEALAATALQGLHAAQHAAAEAPAGEAAAAAEAAPAAAPAEPPPEAAAEPAHAD